MTSVRGDGTTRVRVVRPAGPAPENIDLRSRYERTLSDPSASSIARERAAVELAVLKLHLPTPEERKAARARIRRQRRAEAARIAEQESGARAAARAAKSQEERLKLIEGLKIARAQRQPPKRVRDKEKDAERKRIAYAAQKERISARRAARRAEQRAELGASPTRALSAEHYEKNRERILANKRQSRKKS